MDIERDLITADRDFLIAISAQPQATVLEQQRVIERLERRIAELEGQAKPDDPPRMPGLKSSLDRQPPAQQQPSKQRHHGFARPCMTPTQRVEHVMDTAPTAEPTCPAGGRSVLGKSLLYRWLRRKLPSTSIWPAPAPGADAAVFLRRNWTAW